MIKFYTNLNKKDLQRIPFSEQIVLEFINEWENLYFHFHLHDWSNNESLCLSTTKPQKGYHFPNGMHLLPIDSLSVFEENKSKRIQTIVKRAYKSLKYYKEKFHKQKTKHSTIDNCLLMFEKNSIIQHFMEEKNENLGT